MLFLNFGELQKSEEEFMIFIKYLASYGDCMIPVDRNEIPVTFAGISAVL